MDELYVKIYSRSEHGSAMVPLETLITIFTLKYCDDACVHLILVVPCAEDMSTTLEVRIPSFCVDLSGLNYETQEERQLPPMARSCALPIILLADNATCVAGLCSVLRQVIKISPTKYHHLLGFRSGCLIACAEVSLWTRFCEIDIAQSINNLFAQDCLEQESVIIPKDLMRFEVHLDQPMRTHNILKKRQDLAKARVGDEEIIEHAFAEGPSMTLSDIILFSCFHVIFKIIRSSNLEKIIPLIMQWFDRVRNQEGLSKLITFVSGIQSKVNENTSYEIPTVPIQSLYKSDPKRYKPRNRIYTKQEDIDTSLKIVSEVGLLASVLDRPFGWEVALDWATVPLESLPENGNLPESRVDRKRQQLENLSRAVMKIAKPKNVIVDFCSGSGHLGLLLAVLLPKCRIMLLENKQESLDRARRRGSKLGLKNVDYIQSNLGYFRGKFNIGVALHACGVATDLVLERCMMQRASFVCCPCCYGGLQATHAICYPRSVLLRDSALSLRDYLVLGHAADQTHGADHDKTDQGNKCMALIDADRCQAARERGYHVTMAKLDPPSCTPKNNLLVGVPLDNKK